MIDIILRKLDKVKRNGRGSWMACCPAHDDRTPSLSLKEMPDGRVILHCFAGCSGADIMGAIGMSLSDLYPDGAVSRHLIGAAQAHGIIEGKKKEKATAAKEKDRLLLAVANSKRQYGEKLSANDLKLEREAYKRYHADNY